MAQTPDGGHNVYGEQAPLQLAKAEAGPFDD